MNYKILPLKWIEDYSSWIAKLPFDAYYEVSYRDNKFIAKYCRTVESETSSEDIHFGKTYNSIEEAKEAVEVYHKKNLIEELKEFIEQPTSENKKLELVWQTQKPDIDPTTTLPYHSYSSTPFNDSFTIYKLSEYVYRLEVELKSRIGDMGNFDNDYCCKTIEEAQAKAQEIADVLELL